MRTNNFMKTKQKELFGLPIQSKATKWQLVLSLLLWLIGVFFTFLIALLELAVFICLRMIAFLWNNILITLIVGGIIVGIIWTSSCEFKYLHLSELPYPINSLTRKFNFEPTLKSLAEITATIKNTSKLDRFKLSEREIDLEVINYLGVNLEFNDPDFQGSKNIIPRKYKVKIMDATNAKYKQCLIYPDSDNRNNLQNETIKYLQSKYKSEPSDQIMKFAIEEFRTSKQALELTSKDLIANNSTLTKKNADVKIKDALKFTGNFAEALAKPGNERNNLIKAIYKFQVEQGLVDQDGIISDQRETQKYLILKAKKNTEILSNILKESIKEDSFKTSRESFKTILANVAKDTVIKKLGLDDIYGIKQELKETLNLPKEFNPSDIIDENKTSKELVKAIYKYQGDNRLPQDGVIKLNGDIYKSLYQKIRKNILVKHIEEKYKTDLEFPETPQETSDKLATITDEINQDLIIKELHLNLDKNKADAQINKILGADRTDPKKFMVSVYIYQLEKDIYYLSGKIDNDTKSKLIDDVKDRLLRGAK